MSLLIKALEQAAKDRDSAKASTTPSTPPGGGASAPIEPTLEPPPPPRSAAPSDPAPLPAAAASIPRETPAAQRRAATSMAALANIDAQEQRARAAVVMQAAGQSGHVVWSYLRGNPVMMLGALAAVFGIGFGIYVYLQIANPGIFVRQAATRPQDNTAAAPTPAPPSVQPATPPAADAGTIGTAAPAGSPARAAAAPEVPTNPAVALPGAPAPPPSGGTAGATPAPATPAPIASASVIGSTAEPPRERAADRVPDATRERGSFRTAPEAPKPPATVAAGAATPAPAATARERIAVSAGSAQPRLNPMLSEAYALLQAGSVDEARDLYGKLSQAEPLNIDGLLGLAYIAAQENRSDDAMKLYLRILQLNPRHAVAQAALIGLMGRADPVASETRLKQLISREPSAFLHFVLGNLYADQSMWAQAQQAYFQAHHLEPDNPDYAYNLAIGLDHLRQSKLALSFYRRAAELAAAQGRSNFNLSHVRERISSLSSQLE